jgi:hypothetical protein
MTTNIHIVRAHRTELAQGVIRAMMSHVSAQVRLQ